MWIVKTGNLEFTHFMGKPNSCPLANNRKRSLSRFQLIWGPILWAERAESDSSVLVAFSPAQWGGGKSSAFQEKEISQAGWKINALRFDFVPVTIHWKFQKRSDFQHATYEFLKWNLVCMMPVQWEKEWFLAAAALQSPRLWADRARSRYHHCFRSLFFQAPSW